LNQDELLESGSTVVNITLTFLTSQEILSYHYQTDVAKYVLHYCIYSKVCFVVCSLSNCLFFFINPPRSVAAQWLSGWPSNVFRRFGCR